MEDSQKINFPLDAPLDFDSADMLCPVTDPHVAHNQQQYQGSVLPNSLRYEHDGWFAGWHAHEFSFISGGTVSDSEGDEYSVKKQQTYYAPVYHIINTPVSFDYYPLTKVIKTYGQGISIINDTADVLTVTGATIDGNQYTALINKDTLAVEMSDGFVCDECTFDPQAFAYTLRVTDTVNTVDIDRVLTVGSNCTLGLDDLQYSFVNGVHTWGGTFSYDGEYLTCSDGDQQYTVDDSTIHVSYATVLECIDDVKFDTEDYVVDVGYMACASLKPYLGNNGYYYADDKQKPIQQNKITFENAMLIADEHPAYIDPNEFRVNNGIFKLTLPVYWSLGICPVSQYPVNISKVNASVFGNTGTGYGDWQNHLIHFTIDDIAQPINMQLVDAGLNPEDYTIDITNFDFKISDYPAQPGRSIYINNAVTPFIDGLGIITNWIRGDNTNTNNSAEYIQVIANNTTDIYMFLRAKVHFFKIDLNGLYSTIKYKLTDVHTGRVFDNQSVAFYIDCPRYLYDYTHDEMIGVNKKVSKNGTHIALEDPNTTDRTFDIYKRDDYYPLACDVELLTTCTKIKDSAGYNLFKEPASLAIQGDAYKYDHIKIPYTLKNEWACTTVMDFLESTVYYQSVNGKRMTQANNNGNALYANARLPVYEFTNSTYLTHTDTVAFTATYDSSTQAYTLKTDTCFRKFSTIHNANIRVIIVGKPNMYVSSGFDTRSPVKISDALPSGMSIANRFIDQTMHHAILMSPDGVVTSAVADFDISTLLSRPNMVTVDIKDTTMFYDMPKYFKNKYTGDVAFNKHDAFKVLSSATVDVNGTTKLIEDTTYLGGMQIYFNSENGVDRYLSISDVTKNVIPDICRTDNYDNNTVQYLLSNSSILTPMYEQYTDKLLFKFNGVGTDANKYVVPFDRQTLEVDTSAMPVGATDVFLTCNVRPESASAGGLTRAYVEYTLSFTFEGKKHTVVDLSPSEQLPSSEIPFSIGAIIPGCALIYAGIKDIPALLDNPTVHKFDVHIATSDEAKRNDGSLYIDVDSANGNYLIRDAYAAGVSTDDEKCRLQIGVRSYDINDSIYFYSVDSENDVPAYIKSMNEQDVSNEDRCTPMVLGRDDNSVLLTVDWKLDTVKRIVGTTIHSNAQWQHGLISAAQFEEDDITVTPFDRTMPASATQIITADDGKNSYSFTYAPVKNTMQFGTDSETLSATINLEEETAVVKNNIPYSMPIDLKMSTVQEPFVLTTVVNGIHTLDYKGLCTVEIDVEHTGVSCDAMFSAFTVNNVEFTTDMIAFNFAGSMFDLSIFVVEDMYNLTNITRGVIKDGKINFDR